MGAFSCEFAKKGKNNFCVDKITKIIRKRRISAEFISVEKIAKKFNPNSFLKRK
jgi:hypothetical protein